MGFLDRLQHAYNAFVNNRDPTFYRQDIGHSYGYRPDRPRLSRGNERSIVTSVLNRIALDVAAIDIRHVRLDEDDRFMEYVDSHLDDCLHVEANIDQTGRSFIHDTIMSAMDEGVMAMVPIDTTSDPNKTGSYDILSMRTGKILEWFPRHVKVRVYNDRTGEKEDIIVAKSSVAIIENPFYAVMNEQNSTLKRLIRKLNILDTIDEKSASGKLDLIVQLPYSTRSELRRGQANTRRQDIEDQLKGPYGIAYIDSSEKVIQLNRPVENNLLSQIEYLTSMLYSQLGITKEILEGTANEQTMLNYDNRIVETFATVLVEEMRRKFLTKTARSQGQSIMYFRDPLKLVSVTQIAEIGDKLTRNEIATSNEIRQSMGWKPSKDPKADELRNKNLSAPAEQMEPPMEEIPMEEPVESENIADFPISDLS